MQNQDVKHCGTCGWIGSSIGRKQLIGLTGLGLSGFLLMHMAGNMLILVGPQAYNEYSHALTSNPLLIVAEIVLLLMFLGHMMFALKISWSNYKARDSRYAVMSNGVKRTSWIRRSLWAQGLLILAFIILHLATFKYGPHYTVNYGKGEMRDLHKLVLEVFSEPGYDVWYAVALVVLGLHLGHGVASSFQTLGINHPRYNCGIKTAGLLYTVVVIAGFLSQPFYVYFIHRG